MAKPKQKPEVFNHGRYAYANDWCRCEECVAGNDKYNEGRREYARQLREIRAYYKDLATIPVNPLIEWIDKNNKWEAVDEFNRFKRRTLLRNKDTKISIYEADKLCKIFNVHPIEIYGWNWITNPDITEGAEVVD